MRKLLGQFLRFGVVGLGGLVIDVAVFNLLRLTILSPDVLHEGPVVAKVISTTLAIGANWIGNRRWTFATTGRTGATREGAEFAVVSVAGMGIGLLCLWVSHYVLGFTSLLADNIATNVVGLALGAVFRFALYRWWVFSPSRGVLAAEHAAAQSARAATHAAHIAVDAAADAALGTTERAVGPAGRSPLHRVQAVSPIEDRAHRND
ncbi:GtrA family protein [Salinibacterium sp. NSLL150]|uniref:GtrA family protein n=1 Tax=unclassified Salinibacterium TaxID=2632331 RepID=UPI0018CD9BC8|nr:MULTISPECIES: GtrA family protein [unclassified Salinibacterium]MBH0098498.1 GtrA family protein [Salinibacterium sp. NSLL35]MBH0101253.1 GtrA family protein [Salinibacterium sp. NSLL150]MBH0104012.1 GtrA family protein [Salinibacterium sp. NSLL16]MBH0106773.1 GtrA family protein [Salinibacterium sp. NSLL17]MBH0109455.1 GtrA family protein [Salinibacterium sp. NG22]